MEQKSMTVTKSVSAQVSANKVSITATVTDRKSVV